jgi:signal transduction histidine kinase
VDAFCSTHTASSPSQSGGWWITPPRGTARATSWTPLNVVLAPSHETVAKGSPKESAASMNNEGEIQRLTMARRYGGDPAARNQARPGPDQGFPASTRTARCATIARMTATRLARPALAGAAVPLGFVAYRVQVDDLHSPELRAAAIVAVAWAFVAAGLVAWYLRPANRMGLLMTAVGFALLARQLRYSEDALVFTVFFLIGDVGYVLAGHATLAYPSGRVSSSIERQILRVAYAAALAFPLAILLLHGPDDPLRSFDPVPRRSLLLVSGHAQLASDLQKAFAVVLYGGLAVTLCLFIARRLSSATTRSRRLLAPLLLAGMALGLRAVLECVFTFVNRPRALAYDYLFWWQIAAFLALPAALLAGVLRARLARASVGDLVVELEHAPPEGVREALARALRDPTLEVAFWLPEQGAYVDATGRAIELPGEHDGRAATLLDDGGAPLAALVHDRSLDDEERLVRAAGAAARMALVNARLRAELISQLRAVEEARRRVAAAADGERRRIERDLHDGAQQRLVALAVQLRTAQHRMGAEADPAVDSILEAGVDELQAAVVELRRLAHGINPVSEDGLAAALESLAARTPLPVTVDLDDGELPPEVETTAYFVACEALANTVKHAHATSAALRTTVRGGVLTVEVADDGVGGARPDGSGLSGLAERVEAFGGTLRIESGPRGGTRVIGEIPCAS